MLIGVDLAGWVIQVQYPAFYTKSLSGNEDFPSAADPLLKLTDAVWCTPESPIPGSVHLDLWQRWLLRHILELYPLSHPRAGQLRYRQVLVSMGRQNGKSLISSILAVWGLLREPGAVVIGVASSVDQARIIYDRVKFCTEAVPQLAKHFTRSSVTRGLETTTHSTYELKASKSAAVQGIPVSVGLPDELHLTRAEMWQALVNGTGAKANGIVVGITTAGDSGSALLIDLYDRARKAVEVPDSRMGVFVWEAPDASVTCVSAFIQDFDPHALSVALGGVTESMTIAEHMDMACASARQMYFVGEDGNITCSPDWGPNTVIPDPPLVTNYTAIEAGLNSKTIVNTFNIVNKRSGVEDMEFNVYMPESVARYGTRPLPINMCVAVDEVVQVVATDYLRTANNGEFSATAFSVPNRFPPTDTSPDPLGRPIRITQNGKFARAWIISEQITIKPKLWVGQSVYYTYQLAPRQLMLNESFQGV